MSVIPLYLAVEDDLSETVVRVVLKSCSQNYAVGPALGKKGSGWLKSKIFAYNLTARTCPFLVVTDLDDVDCPPSLIEAWLPRGKHHNLLLRIPVREIEAWVMSDRVGLASFLGINSTKIPADTETIENPKEFLIRLAKGSRNRVIRSDIVPALDSTAKVGPNYNARLGTFVMSQWSALRAVRASRSLKSTIERLNTFVPLAQS